MFSFAMQAQAALTPPPPALAVLFKILAKKSIGPDIVFEKDDYEQDEIEENGEEEQVEKNKSAQACALSPQIARVIR